MSCLSQPLPQREPFAPECGSPSDAGPCGPLNQGVFMNNIIYLVGLIVIVLAILSFLGLR
ncbi:hypothetical protein ACXIUS_09275 [Bosea thiooxidans]|nr:hypothetical protein [Bosea sp. (in: a-proteobacteria)]